MIDVASHWIFPVHAVARPGPLPRGAAKLEVRAKSGDILHGIHLGPDSARPDKSLVLGFGGNAWNAQDAAEFLHRVYPESDVVTFYYRGYSPSQGSPSAEALIADAPLLFDFAVKRIAPKKVVAVGLSIGSGVAATLAQSRKLDGVILVTPFASLREVAQAAVPWIPFGPFFGHEIDAAAALEKSHTKVAIIAGGRDDIVPRQCTEALRERVSNLVFDKTIATAGHNDIYARSDFQAALREAKKRLIS
jgi:pimeloyl-ACP methyl ester carboxylesterase